MIVQFIDYLRDRLKTVIYLCYAGLGVLLLLDIFWLDKSHVHTAMEKWPGFWTVFGFVACVLIIILSKWFGHLGIMTREDYYD